MNSGEGKIGRRAMMMLMAAAGFCPLRAEATTWTWDGGVDGNWSVATNWVDPHTGSQNVPGSSDTVDISFFGPSFSNGNVTIAYDYAGPAVTLNSLTLGTSEQPILIHSCLIR